MDPYIMASSTRVTAGEGYSYGYSYGSNFEEKYVYEDDDWDSEKDYNINGRLVECLSKLADLLQRQYVCLDQQNNDISAESEIKPEEEVKDRNQSKVDGPSEMEKGTEVETLSTAKEDQCMMEFVKEQVVGEENDGNELSEDIIFVNDQEVGKRTDFEKGEKHKVSIEKDYEQELGKRTDDDDDNRLSESRIGELKYYEQPDVVEKALTDDVKNTDEGLDDDDDDPEYVEKHGVGDKLTEVEMKQSAGEEEVKVAENEEQSASEEVLKVVENEDKQGSDTENVYENAKEWTGVKWEFHRDSKKVQRKSMAKKLKWTLRPHCKLRYDFFYKY
ncbi:protein IWS1 homolog [Lingula anatina]|uniref:Protein IWS1 homolog n=1 Tax=Lingula anatina TaxID=7574 RepID=A0A1S3IMX4_LINAN|nr:protein IWS1 homolog [Lingula anatina]|eukprot:XP_013398889.1 protein IWS1 homolog [Lingula anatina]